VQQYAVTVALIGLPAVSFWIWQGLKFANNSRAGDMQRHEITKREGDKAEAGSWSHYSKKV